MPQPGRLVRGRTPRQYKDPGHQNDEGYVEVLTHGHPPWAVPLARQL